MHEIVPEGTATGRVHSLIMSVWWILISILYLAEFAEKASATGQNLASVLDQLKKM